MMQNTSLSTRPAAGLILLLALLLTFSILTGCAAPTPVATPSPTPLPNVEEPRLTLLAFGDSLTEGLGVPAAESYPAQLERKLRADGIDIEVINGGISGETTTAALSRVSWMLNTNPDIVIVETGANDALRGVDLELTARNIDQIVGEFNASGAIVVVAGLQIIQNLGEEYTAAFAAIYPAVAETHEVMLIPFVLEGVAADPDLNQPDFIHPTAEGYTVMVDHIYPFVLEAIAAAEARRTGG